MMKANTLLKQYKSGLEFHGRKIVFFMIPRLPETFQECIGWLVVSLSMLKVILKGFLLYFEA